MRPDRLSASSPGTQTTGGFSLRAKLLALSVLLVAVPGAVFAMLAFSAAHDALRGAAGRQLVEAARDHADNVADDIADLHNDLAGWARNEVMRDLLIGDVDKRVARLLRTIKQGGQAYLELFCVDRDGVVVASSKATLVGKRLDEDWVEYASRHSAAGLRGPRSVELYSREFLEAIQPIPHPDDAAQRIGSLVAFYDLGRIDADALQLRRNLAEIGADVDVFLLDETGKLIGGSWDEPGSVRAGQNLRELGWKSARSTLPADMPRGFEEEPAAEVFAGYSEVRSVRPGWRVLVTQSIDDALAPVAALRTRWAIALAAVVVVGLLLAGLLAERMVRPLRALTRATEVTRLFGAEAEPLAITSGDEIGQLTAAFNTMAGELRGARRELINAARLALVGEMAAGIAHEVRTPLGILRTSAQVLRRSIDAPNAKQLELLEIMVDETERLSRVVTELLDLARPRLPAAQSVDLRAVLDRAIDFVKTQAMEKGVAVKREFCDDPSPAWCDPEQIYQVALNLLVNATQSVPAGGTILVRLEPQRSERVAFEVADDGPGIAEEVQDKIFAPFFTTRKSGTGLGLALVERIVSAHKGTISVASAPGAGAAFRVTLPIAEEIA